MIDRSDGPARFVRIGAQLRWFSETMIAVFDDSRRSDRWSVTLLRPGDAGSYSAGVRGSASQR